MLRHTNLHAAENPTAEEARVGKPPTHTHRSTGSLYNGPSKLNPPPLPAVALSPEETVQADTAVATARTRDAAWLSHVQINLSSRLGSTLI